MTYIQYMYTVTCVLKMWAYLSFSVTIYIEADIRFVPLYGL
jgi:hypothetical protein